MEIKNNHNFAPIEGKYVNLREVQIEDAAFILSLRCDPKKSRFLHKTENNLEKQIDYLKHYFSLDNEWYFVVENKKQYTGGSWLMKDGSLPEETLEGSMLAREMAYEKLGFELDCFDVRKGNKKVVRYHQMWGAKIVGESDIDYFFELTKETYLQHKTYFKSML